MPEQARGDYSQGEGQVALVGKGGRGVGEGVRLSPGEQVQSRRCFFGAARVKSLSVWLPVPGALVIEPGDEAITGDQVRHDRGGVIPQQGGRGADGPEVSERRDLARRA